MSVSVPARGCPTVVLCALTLASVLGLAGACKGPNPAYRESPPSGGDGGSDRMQPDLADAAAAEVPAKEVAGEEARAEHTPEVAPEVAAEVAPEVAPEVALETAPELAPEVSPALPPGATTNDRTVTLSSATTSGKRFGGTGGNAFEQRCPAGQALVGYRSNEHNYVNGDETYLIGLQGICAELQIPARTTAARHGSGSTLPWSGRNESGSTFHFKDSLCADGQVIVGLVARWNKPEYVEHMEFRCAPLAAVDFPAGAVTPGAIVTLPITGVGDTEGAETADCPSGQIVVGHIGRAGSRIDAFQLTCATPTAP